MILNSLVGSEAVLDRFIFSIMACPLPLFLGSERALDSRPLERHLKSWVFRVWYEIRYSSPSIFIVRALFQNSKPMRRHGLPNPSEYNGVSCDFWRFLWRWLLVTSWTRFSATCVYIYMLPPKNVYLFGLLARFYLMLPCSWERLILF